jgi:hypothetical protein
MANTPRKSFTVWKFQDSISRETIFQVRVSRPGLLDHCHGQRVMWKGLASSAAEAREFALIEFAKAGSHVCISF